MERNGRFWKKDYLTRRIICGLVAVLMLVGLCPLPSFAETEPAGTVVDVGIPMEEHPEVFLPGTMPSRGEGKIAVFLIDFPDARNDNPNATVEYYEELYFGEGVDTTWGEMSVARFFREQSYGKLNLSGKVFDWYTAKHDRDYYVNRQEDLIMEAAEYYQSRGEDFSRFDGDGDGCMDAVIFHFEHGVVYGHQSLGGWNSGSAILLDGNFGTIDGLAFKSYTQIWEEALCLDEYDFMITTICRSLLRGMGMHSLSTEAKGPKSTLTTDLMAESENAINPYYKILLGWVDQVRVITEDAKNVRLEPNGNGHEGEIVLVTDQFNGFFDEFYLVEYRYFQQYYNVSLDTGAAVWHIDGRLTKNGKEFLYSNQYFHDRPESEEGDWSPFLLVEELSGDPRFGFATHSRPGDLADFHPDSVVGPNSVPSTETHDGVYTGIRIDHFQEHGKEYLTFDVSFVEDTAAPFAVTPDNEMEFKETVGIRFSEFIHEGENWDQIRVTDVDGNPLDATLICRNYPGNLLEINFHDAAYLKGYRVVLPEGSLRDAAGNPIEKIIRTASLENYLLSTHEVKLPGVGDYKRDGFMGNFQDEDGLTVITRVYGYGDNDKIEFMRLDNCGNLTQQSFVETPFLTDYTDLQFYRTGDGCYIGILNNDGWWDRFLCLDRDGNLLWTNDDYYQTGTRIYPNFIYSYKDGLILRLWTDNGTEPVLVHSATGAVEPLEGHQLPMPVELSESKLLCFPYVTEDKIHIELVDKETCEVLASNDIENTSGKAWYPRSATENDGGTILLYMEDEDYLERVYLLDAALNVVKFVELADSHIYAEDVPYWIPNDGFFEQITVKERDHDDTDFHIRRYDRYLNIIWETDITAYGFFYFITDEGGVMAYRSSFSSQSSYVMFHSSEESYKSPHTHTLVQVPEVGATCMEQGIRAYWRCEDCGCSYLDEGITPLTDPKVLQIPMDHVAVAIPGEKATCVSSGWTEGVTCSVCGLVIQPRTSIDPNDEHEFGQWRVLQPATAQEYGTEMRECSLCHRAEFREIDKLPAEDTPSIPVFVPILALVAVVMVIIVAKRIMDKNERE